jgi:hypothetical protein
MILLNLYVIHSKIVAARKDAVMQLAKKLNDSNLFKVNMKLVEDYEPDQISGDMIKKYTNFEKTGVEHFDSQLKSIHIRNLSNGLKHFAAIQHIANTESMETPCVNLVVEDDILYGERIVEQLIDVIQSLPTDFDLVFTGLPNNKAANGYVPFNELYKIAPSCESYIISSSCAKKVHTSYLPIKFSTNIHLSYIIHKLNLAAFIAKSHVFIDGSKYGVYLSVIEPNNMLWMNPDFHKLKAISESSDKSAEHVQKVIAMFNGMQFKNHPDVMHMYARFVKNNVGDLQKVREIYAAIYAALSQNNCLLNNESLFLKDYIEICAHTQESV